MARTRRRSSYRKNKRWNPHGKRAARRHAGPARRGVEGKSYWPDNVTSYAKRHRRRAERRNLKRWNPKSRRGRKAKSHRGHKAKNRRHFPIYESSPLLQPGVERTTSYNGRFRFRRGRHAVPRASHRRGYIHGRRGGYIRAKRWKPIGRNPGVDRARPAYGQWLMKLGFPVNDPIVELGAAWAAGVTVEARLVNQAVLSAERWRESRDRRLRSAATAIINKLAPLHKGIAAKEDRGQFRHAERSLTSHGHRNPRGHSTKASRARSWQRKVKDSIPWWEKGRKNPFQESWHVQQEMRKARGAKGRGRSSRRALRKLSKGRRAAVISGVLGRMNPKRRRNPAQFPMPFVSAMNPGRGRRGRR